MNNAISIYNLEKIVYQNQFYFIDIRESYQYDQLHIYNFENIPYDILINKLDYLPKDKPLCLICYSGERGSPENFNKKDIALTMLKVVFKPF